MTDCTHVAPDGRRARQVLACLACLALAVAGMALGAGTARADGDPASDVLATGTLFLPQDARVSQSQQLQLQSLVREAASSGYPIRVALIASPADLGSIAELWRQPPGYANFLGQELSLTYRGALLVIMPNGFGLFDQGRSVARSQAALSRVPLHAAGPGMGVTALAAVRQLAAAGGHPLAVPRATRPGSAPGGEDVLPWLVFLVGLLLIGLAWTASVRARPLRLGQRDAPAS